LTKQRRKRRFKENMYFEKKKKKKHPFYKTHKVIICKIFKENHYLNVISVLLFYNVITIQAMIALYFNEEDQS